VGTKFCRPGTCKQEGALILLESAMAAAALFWGGHRNADRTLWIFQSAICYFRLDRGYGDWVAKQGVVWIKKGHCRSCSGNALGIFNDES